MAPTLPLLLLLPMLLLLLPDVFVLLLVVVVVVVVSFPEVCRARIDIRELTALPARLSTNVVMAEGSEVNKSTSSKEV